MLDIFLLYLVISVVLIVALFVFKWNYVKKHSSIENSDEHKLWKFYGLSMYLIDIFSKRKNSVLKSIIINSEEMNQDLSKIYIENKNGKNSYLFMCKKLTITLGLILIINSVTFFLIIEEKYQKSESIETLKRNEMGEGNKTYEVILEDETDIKKVDLVLKEIKWSEEKINTYLDEVFELVVKKMLGKNKSLDEIHTNINLITNYDEVEVMWLLSEDSVINYSGEINFENVKKNKVKEEINIILSFLEVKKKYKVSVNVIKNEVKENIESKINKLINDEKLINNYDVELPKSIDGNEIKYYKDSDKVAIYVFIFGSVLIVLINLVFKEKIKNKLSIRENEMYYDYSTIINKMVLLQESGLTIIKSWKKIVDDYENYKNVNDKNKRYVFEEMKLTLNMINNGKAQGEAYIEFGKRCGLKEYIRFANLLEQNLKIGSYGFQDRLKEELKEAFEKRKSVAQKKGDEASTKLLFPMIIMLIISIAVIIVPAFMTTNF